MLKQFLLAGLLCTQLLAIEIEGLVPIGPYQSHQRQHILGKDQSHLEIQFLAPDLVRVRTSFRQPLDDTPSWAIAQTQWPQVAVTALEQPHQIVYSSSALKVIVHKDPLTVEVQDAQGRLVVRDHHPVMGDPAKIHQSKLFDPETGSMLVATKSLGLDEHFYALGEKAHRLDLRRGKFTMWNSDTPRYGEGKDPIYQSIPFYVGLNRGRAYGLFYDNSHRSHFDFGNSQQEWAGYAVEGGQMDAYIFQGPSIKKVLERYTQLTGRIELPPKWALGHQASRWSYHPAAMVEEIARTYQEHDLPLDVMTLDIDYMQKYRVFTWDRQRFPDPSGLTARLKAKGLHTVTIVDPGVKYQPSAAPAAANSTHPELEDQGSAYYVYDQGLAQDYFIRRRDGQLMIGEVWPGASVFVDYTLEGARRWWGDLHRAYFDHGVGGIWNDMNEPADFKDQTGGNQRDARYYDHGRKTGHSKNRNVIALLMARSTYEGWLRLRPNERPYIITRAAYAGIQRYATMWTGDAPSTWEGLALSLPILCNLGLSGESFIGADIGGFMGRADGELLARAYQIGFLLPFCRNHKEQAGYDQEPWRFGPYYESIIRRYLKLRYQLLPYLYAGLDEARRSGQPLIRPLVLEFQSDPQVVELDDQIMVGPSLLLAPVTRPAQEWRRVYLPPQSLWYDFYSGQKVAAGMIKAPAPLEKVPLYVRGGSILPLGPAKNTVEALPNAPLELRIYPDARGEAQGTLYEDDGRSRAYLKGACARRQVSFRQGRLTVEPTQYPLPQRKLLLRLGQGSLVVPDRAQGQQVSLP